MGENVADRLSRDLAREAPVKEGTIITWDSVSEYVTYRYAAIFAAGSWYTTVSRDNRYVQKMMSHTDLMKYLGANAGVKNLMVAMVFEEVRR